MEPGDRKITAIFAVICVVLLAGGILDFVHPGAEYSSEATLTSDGVDYSFSAGPSSDANIVVIDNGMRRSVEKLYIYYDDAYAFSDTSMERLMENLRNRFDSRGMEYEMADAEKLLSVVSGPTERIGILMSTGTMPENVASGPLLDWVRAGGTLYWTRDVIGTGYSTPDGNVHYFEVSKEADYLGSSCTESALSWADRIVEGDPFTSALHFMNAPLWGALRSDEIVPPHLCTGCSDGTVSEISFVSCGSGTVCVIGGQSSFDHVNEIVQTVCSGLTLDSTLVHTETMKVDHGKSVEGHVSFTPVSGHEYSVFIYVSGTAPPYSETYRLVMP